MKIEHYAEGIYVEVREGKVDHSTFPYELVTIDHAVNEEVLGVEILKPVEPFGGRLHKEPTRISRD